MKQTAFNVACALNSKYMRYTYVMLKSLLMTQQQAFGEINIYLLHNDLTESDKEYLMELVQSHGGNLTFLFVDKSRLSSHLPSREYWSIETYFRLMLVDMLPPTLERILYLDVDIIINSSLEELYSADFEGNVLCACADPVSIYPFGTYQDILFEEPIKAGFVYFCAGVLLLNLESMRGRYDLSYYMELAKKLEYKMPALDQDLLNYAHWNEVRLLDADKYNRFAGIAYCNGLTYDTIKESACIVHFAGNKPWNGKSLRHEIDGIWWDYAKLTPFYHTFLEEFVDGAIHSTFFNERLRWIQDRQKWDEEKKQLTAALNESSLLLQKTADLMKEKGIM